MESKIFDIVQKYKGYELFKHIVKHTKDIVLEAEKEMTIEADNTLTELSNLINNSGWDTAEVHSKVLDILSEANRKYDKYLED